MLGRQRAAVVRHCERQEVELNVRIVHSRPVTDEAAALEMVGGVEPVAAQEPARADERLGEGIHHPEERDRLRAGNLKIEFEVVLEMRPTPGRLCTIETPS